MTLSAHQRLLWGAIASCEGVGPATIRALFAHGLGSEEVWSAPSRLLVEAGVKRPTAERFLAWRSTFDLSFFEERLNKASITLSLKEDPTYPIALRTIHSPPEVLFVRGTLPPPKLSVAVIGTRRPTDYGRQAVSRLLTPIIQAGIPIISGLALGTDAYVHEATLKEHGYTCGVLGSGVDDASIYPKYNASLAARILEEGGCILSEFPPGTYPKRGHFPIRNRIIAGLVQAVVVIEASLESGTLITARSALEEGREVLAVPGSIWSETSAGTHHLIRSGARLCAHADDIFEALRLDRVESSVHAQQTLPLTHEEQQLFTELTHPQSADELCRHMRWTVGQVNQALSMLELKQLIIRLPHQAWGRA